MRMRRRQQDIGELSYLGLGELEALRVGSEVRVKRFALLFTGVVVWLGPVPPLRNGRRIARNEAGETTPDVGARRVKVRLQLIRRTREVEVQARELIRAVQGDGR